MVALLAAVQAALWPGVAAAQNGGDNPEELVLKVVLAQDLAKAALADAVLPIGGVLGKIGPSGSLADGVHGFGFLSASVGVTGLGFSITDPNYTKTDRVENAGTIEGPIGAFYADVEIGLFEGYRTPRTDGLLGMDLLVRVGATVGDQEDLGERVEVSRLAPIYGVGMRVGLLRGAGLPAVSVAGGWSDFTERTFKVLGADAGTDFEVGLRFRQMGSYFVGEIAHRFGWVVLDAGGGVTWQRFQAHYDAEVVYETSPSVKATTAIAEDVDYHDTMGLAFAGLELGSNRFRVVLEGGAASGEPYGSLYFRITPLLGGR